jgi:hypothetical protein
MFKKILGLWSLTSNKKSQDIRTLFEFDEVGLNMIKNLLV